MTKRMKAALMALTLGISAVAASAALAQPRDDGHGPRAGDYGAAPGIAPGGEGARGGYGGPRGGGYDGWDRYRGYGGYRTGYGAPFAYDYYGWGPGGWYPAPYYPAPYYSEGYYDERDYDAPPPPAYYPEPPPKAEPQPPPRAAAARAFIVYFPFDTDALTEAAKRVVDDAAHYAAHTPGGRLTIVGYTDAAGSEGYNQALSERRSQIVRQTLLADGVGDGSVDMAWRGKHDLAIKTPDGVKEPQNRRVTILVRAPGEAADDQRGWSYDDGRRDDERR